LEVLGDQWASGLESRREERRCAPARRQQECRGDAEAAACPWFPSAHPNVRPPATGSGTLRLAGAAAARRRPSAHGGTGEPANLTVATERAAAGGAAAVGRAGTAVRVAAG